MEDIVTTLAPKKLESIKIDLQNNFYELNGVNLSEMFVSKIDYRISGTEHEVVIEFEDMLRNKFRQKFNNFF